MDRQPSAIQAPSGLPPGGTWYLEYEVEALREVLRYRLKARNQNQAVKMGRRLYHRALRHNRNWSHRGPAVVYAGDNFQFKFPLEKT